MSLETLDRRARWIVVCVAFLMVYRYLLWQVNWTIDDAYITFRYAENVVAGHGPVYNPGEAVEGYTCFWWMALLAAAGKLGIPVPMFAKAAGMACAFASVAIVAFWDRAEATCTRTEALLAAICVATTASFLQWGPSGMETAMFCTLAVAVVFVYLRLWSGGRLHSAISLGLLGTLLTMTRPNGIVLLSVILAHALIHRRDFVTRHLVLMVGTFVATFGLYFAWRWNYYGYFLPNTFYAKVGASGAQLNRGVRYAIAAMPAYGILIAPVIMSWGRPQPAPKGHKNGTGLLLALTVTHIVYVISVGGDNFPAHRFLVVIVPFLALLSIRAIMTLGTTAARRALLAAVVIGYNFAAQSFDPETRSRVRKDYVAGQGTIVGRWLASHTEPDAVIATNSAGALAYFSQRPVVDMLGLNDAHIAHTPVASMGSGKAGHERGNGFYVLAREPDYVLFGGPKGSLLPMFKGGLELHGLKEFQKRYARERHNLTKEFTVTLYRRMSDEEIEQREAEQEAKKKEREAKKKKKKDAKKKKKKKKGAKKKP